MANKCPPLTPEERARAIDRSRRMFQTDLESNLATAEARGEVRGKAIGEAIGEARGKAICEARGAYSKAFDVARKALRMKMSIEDIVDLTGLTLDEVEGLM